MGLGFGCLVPKQQGYLRILGVFRGFWRLSEAAPSWKTRLGLVSLSEVVLALLAGDLALQEGA
jgi:hypothetical protein